ncbi:integral membrane [Pyrenophora seminiperda CCB06]|uniref:Integral membrane n=1 Tax=Pyrenophora seminiperda CCB06 TaxID=1302712 RepID=A0A3M7MJ55_9PLEO|nr:integral membrane [Pyrenophora seminiperda CCB06]
MHTGSANRSSEVFATATVFFILTWLTVGLRIYVRTILMRAWGKDDSYMVATLLVFSIYLPCQIVAAVHGTGRHRWNLSDNDARTALMFWYFCELLYVLTSCLLKFAIGYFYLRFAVEPWHIRCIQLLMAGTVLCGLVYFFLVMFQCTPISEFWNEHPASSHCLSNGPTLGISYSLSVINAIADWALGLLPCFIVWKMNLRMKTKILVAGILAFAAIGSTGTVIRMAYIHTLVDGSDFLYSTTDIAIWSTVEPGIGIAAGSIATLRPLVRHIQGRLDLSNATPEDRSPAYYPSDSDRRRKFRRGHRRSLSPSDLIPTELGHVTSTQNQRPIYVDLESHSPPPNAVVAGIDVPNDEIIPAVAVPKSAEPPKLHLRDSLRHSFTRDGILSPNRYRIPS